MARVCPYVRNNWRVWHTRFAVPMGRLIVSNPLELYKGCFNPLDFSYLIYGPQSKHVKMFIFVFCFRRVLPLQHRPVIYVPGNLQFRSLEVFHREEARVGSLSRSVCAVWFYYIVEGVEVIVLVNGLCLMCLYVWD